MSQKQVANGLPLDVVVIGMGFSGLYAMHSFQNKLGMRVQGLEAADDVGGVWYWNRYPGARVDVESYDYSYSFDEKLEQEYHWTERFAAQPEIQRYLRHFAQRFDLLRSIRFSTRVNKMEWDEATRTWHVATSSGDTVTARYVVACVGALAAPKNVAEFPGIDSFKGECYFTSSWPHHPVAFEAKQVGIVGTGSTGVQAIMAIAPQVGHLTVFQRTANYVTPLGNRPMTDEVERHVKANYKEHRQKSRLNDLGQPYDPPLPTAVGQPLDAVYRHLDGLWDAGGFGLFIASYADLFESEESNEIVSEYIRVKIRETLRNPRLEKLLIPYDHPYGTKRPILGDTYYQVLQQPNVEVVDIKNDPIERVTERGLQVAGREYPLDMLIFATGFDAMTGSFVRLNVEGRNGLRLEDKWAGGPITYLGTMTNGFPNFIMIAGAQSAVPDYNNPLLVENDVDFACDLLKHCQAQGGDRVETKEQSENSWTQACLEIGRTKLFYKTNNWWMGANVPGKPRVPYYYPGGGVAYQAAFEAERNKGFQGFEFSRRVDQAGP